MNWLHLLNGVSLQWAEVMWRAVWQGTLLIVVVWTLSNFAARLLPTAVRSWLWRIVFLKLAVTLIWITPIRLPVLQRHTPMFADQVGSVERLELRPSAL